MRWFKHMVHASDDEKLARLMDQCGLAGYGFFWRVLEIIAAKVDESGKSDCAYSKRTWCMKLAVNHQTWSRMLASCERIGLFVVSEEAQSIRIGSPNILKFRDEYTDRKVRKAGHAPDSHRFSRARVPDAEADPDPESPLPPGGEDGGGGRAVALCEKAVEATGGHDGGPAADSARSADAADAAGPVAAGPSGPSGSSGSTGSTGSTGGCGEWDLAFQQLADAYPEARRDAVAAWPHWLALKKARQLPGLSTLFASLGAWEASGQWRKEGGQFVPLFSNWLKGRRWTMSPQPARESAGGGASEAEVLAELERLGLLDRAGGRK